LNLKELKEILQILDEKEITEFELEEEGIKLRIRKAPLHAANHGAPSISAPHTVSTSVPGGPPPPGPPPVVLGGATSAAPAPEAAAEEPGLVLVKSPIVGTFYRSPDPSAPAFVNVGDHVRVGQVLCIIEAMKLMNEIEAEVGGEIVKIHHENGQPVQYGEPLFAIRTDR
jgi:acetyl-CoA carboxylase biotin carboxyl carrier protein